MNKVAIIAPHFQEYSLLLANALARHAQVLLMVDCERLNSEFEGRKMPVDPGVELFHVRLTSPLDTARILGRIARFRPGVLHVQEASGLIKSAICAAVIAAVRPFARVVLTVHDPVPHAGRDVAIARRIERFRRFSRKAAHVVVVHGNYCRDRYASLPRPHGQELLVSDHGTLLYGGDGPDDPHPVFGALAFGRMEAYKGLDILCTAAERLHDRSVAYHLDVAGSGPELDRLQDRLERLPEVQVRNKYVPSVELIEAIRRADCVVMPYIEATQSGVLAAALANGRFVVASSVGGIPDVIQHGVNGLLVPPGDADALAETLESVAADPATRARLRDGARATAKDKLSWDRIVDQLVVAYGW